MYTIAITGSLGSGKSQALAFFKQQGYPTLSADGLVHQLYKADKALQHRINDICNEEMFDENGVKRERLAQIIFSDSNLKKQVETVVHKAVYEHIKLWQSHQISDIGFVEIPLLFENQSQNEYDTTLLIAIDEETRINRLVNQRLMNHDEIERRLSLQMPQIDKIKLADTVIFNNGDVELLHNQLANYIKGIVDDRK